MKRVLMIVLGLALICAMCVGCSGNASNDAATDENVASQEGDTSGKETASGETESTEDAGEVYNFTLAHHLSPTTVQHIAFEEFVADVEEKTNGRIKITLSPSAALGGEREITEGVNLGTIEMGLSESAIYANYVPEFGIITLPFMFNSDTDFHNVLDGEVGSKLAQKLSDQTNITIISWLDGGVRDIYSSKKIENLEDLQGLKIRTPESPVFVSTFQAFGANPTPIPANEMYSAIQSNVVSAMEGTGEVAYTFKIYEVANYCLESGHIYTDISLIINTDLLNSLPADLKDTLLECAKTLTQNERAIWAEKAGAYKQMMIDEVGMNYATLDQDLAKAAVANVYADYIDGDAAKQDIYDMIIAAQQ